MSTASICEEWVSWVPIRTNANLSENFLSDFKQRKKGLAGRKLVSFLPAPSSLLFKRGLPTTVPTHEKHPRESLRDGIKQKHTSKILRFASGGAKNKNKLDQGGQGLKTTTKER